jgi:beta-glucosidase
VLMSGSAVAINWADEHVAAILESWYPGQAAGSAIADVLFGTYNPAGRLPVTFYRSASDLPPFDDYNMTGRTYRFFKGTPLYPFGHGLSYTTFRYANLRTDKPTLRAGDSVVVAVDVRNTGVRAGDEVVQLYVQHVGSRVPRATKDLRGYRRVTLAPGATTTVKFTVPARAVAYWDSTSHGWVVEPDQLRLQVGASSSDIRLSKLISVVAR